MLQHGLSLKLFISIFLLFSIHLVNAVEVTHTFQSNMLAKAEEVNQNFDDLEAELSNMISVFPPDILDDLPPEFPDDPTLKEVLMLIVSQLADIGSEMQSLQNQIDDINNNLTTASLQSENDFVELGNILTYLHFGSLNGAPAIVVESANLQIVNGDEDKDTYGNSTGTGNLIIGYDEQPLEGGVCDVGTASTEATCTGNWITDNLKQGSHNLVVGGGHVYQGARGAIVTGDNNYVTGNGSAVIAGSNNSARENNSAVVAGENNAADFEHAATVGGNYNLTEALYGVVVGGNNNLAIADKSIVVGGGENTAEAENTLVAGGRLNTTLPANDQQYSGDAIYSTVLGGYLETTPETNPEYSTRAVGLTEIDGP